MKQIIKRILSIADWLTSYRQGIVIFVLGASIYTLSHIWLLADPLLHRPMPIESDDGYTFTLKAEELRSCFLQDCHALEDLEEQLLASTEDPRVGLTRFRQYHRVFIVYHPFFSAILLGINELGFTWEQSFDLLFMVGAIFLTLSIAYWSSRLWNYGPAGIGLILISWHNFFGVGTYSTTPTTITLGIACLSWGWVIHRKEKSSFGLLISIFLMLGMHTTGRLYSFLALGLFILLAQNRFSRKSLITILTGISLVTFTFILPLVTDRPQFGFSPYSFFPGTLDFWEEVLTNLEALKTFFLFWSNTYGGSFLVVLLVVAGFYYLPRDRTKNALVMASLLSMLLVATVFYIFPWFSAIATNRIWVPVAILFTGAVGQTLWHWIENTIEKCKVYFINRSNMGREILVQAGLLSLGLLYITFNAYQHGSHHFPLLRAHMLTSKDYALPIKHMQTIINNTTPSDSIVYLDEVSFYYALNNPESYTRGAVYFPGINNTTEYAEWIENNSANKFIFGINAIQSIDISKQGQLKLPAGDRLIVRAIEPVQISAVYLKILSTSAGDAASFQYTLDGKQEKIIVPGNQKTGEWIRIDLVGLTNLEKFSLHALQGFDLSGIRFSSPTDGLNWPWKTGIEIEYVPKNQLATEEDLDTILSEKKLAERLGLPIRISSDDGSFITAIIEP